MKKGLLWFAGITAAVGMVMVMTACLQNGIRWIPSAFNFVSMLGF